MSGWIVVWFIIVAVVSAYFFPVNNGSNCVTGAGIRPDRRLGSLSFQVRLVLPMYQSVLRYLLYQLESVLNFHIHSGLEK